MNSVPVKLHGPVDWLKTEDTLVLKTPTVQCPGCASATTEGPMLNLLACLWAHSRRQRSRTVDKLPRLRWGQEKRRIHIPNSSLPARRLRRIGLPNNRLDDASDQQRGEVMGHEELFISLHDHLPPEMVDSNWLPPRDSHQLKTKEIWSLRLWDILTCIPLKSSFLSDFSGLALGSPRTSPDAFRPWGRLFRQVGSLPLCSD